MKRDKASLILTQLRNTLSKMELSLGAIDDAIIWVDNRSIIEWCNEKFGSLIGRLPIEILGKHINEVMQLKKQGRPISLDDVLIKHLENESKSRSHLYEFEKNNETILLEVYSRPFREMHEEITIVAVLRDVTERQNAQQRIEFLASIPENNSAPIFSINKQNEVIYSNKAAESLFACWKAEIGQELPTSFISLIDSAIKNQKEYLIEESCLKTQYLFSITPGATENVNIYGTNITARIEAERELVYLSNHDMLTNLYNRPAFEAALKREIVKSYRDNTSFAILLLDLDNFKTVNDTFGHHIGDQLLVTVAKQLKENVRKEDIVARFGGDEFIILLSGIKDIKEVAAFAQHLIDRFNKPFKLENYYFNATISIGIAVAPFSGKDEATLLKNADIALYTVKEVGRNNYQFFSDEIDYAFRQRAELETGMPAAIEKNEFYLVYQPQYKLPNREVVGVEVLLRWQHPKLGLIMPDEFIPLAEKSGFIVPIGEWVLKHACAQYVKWLTAGLIPKNLKFAVNLSPKHLANEQFLSSLQNILKETGMPPQNLELELTETAVMTSAINLDPILEQLRSLGVTISIDDFGAGYSSLTRLKDLPISTLKIDKSFIKNLSKNPDDAVIVKSIIALGDSLGLNVIPEGVETEEQLNLLIQYHCSIVQGFYFGQRPLNADEMSTLLKESFPRANEKI
ncbi:sensor domain-containing protein [Aquicella lusitana]|uniref:PAS domain S-box-containing protein/diguanylate cyclase (GGDEF)-like protein n=1 Tax=Aquicella lusitana TaxID=254246 RepID=A0A370GGF0_9COXI|nr:GGDEF and EAL domain-containing protein [Aquicella lusitana]RDI42868.1 PAS domain S-box-containing protein/diguanylate cyclase (GGDEF)-like protein [Aquicella lusitana]VVC73111.1 Phytochrome-like protein cph2 [Aquicella lusitana]